MDPSVEFIGHQCMGGRDWLSSLLLAWAGLKALHTMCKANSVWKIGGDKQGSVCQAVEDHVTSTEQPAAGTLTDPQSVIAKPRTTGDWLVHLAATVLDEKGREVTKS
jgi:hypothetical protein